MLRKFRLRQKKCLSYKKRVYVYIYIYIYIYCYWLNIADLVIWYSIYWFMLVIINKMKLLILKIRLKILSWKIFRNKVRNSALPVEDGEWVYPVEIQPELTGPVYKRKWSYSQWHYWINREWIFRKKCCFSFIWHWRYCETKRNWRLPSTWQIK